MLERIRFGGLALTLAITTCGANAGATPTDGLLDPCAPAPVSGAENELFKDLPPGSIGSAEASSLHAAGITTGCQASPLLFCPSCEISRAGLVTLLVRAAKLPLVNPTQPTFSDVPASHPFYKEIETAADAGITKGCATGQFCPDAPVPRTAGAILVAKAAGLAPVTPSTPSFSDVPATHAAYPYVEALKAKCVTNGCTATEFCPGNEMLRVQAAVFVAKAFDIGDANPCLGPADGGSAGASGGSGGGQWNDSGLTPLDGGSGTGGSSSSIAEADDDGGCGCALPRGRAGLPLALLLALGVGSALGRRRARGV